MSWLQRLAARFRASDEDRSPYSDFWFTPVGMRSAAGTRVTADHAMRLSAVYAAVRLIAETFATLPVNIYRVAADGERSQARDHWLFPLLTRRPNRYQNAFEWREMLQGHLTLRGNAYCEIVDDAKGQVTDLIPLHPDRIKIEMTGNDPGDYRYVVTNRDGTIDRFNRGSIWHLRGLSADGIMGLSPIAMARESIGLGLAAQEYGGRFFANDATPSGGWIEYPHKFPDAAARQTFRESFQKFQGGKNRGKVSVLEMGMKYHEVGVNNKDSQFLETRKFQVTDIARWFRVPPHMIADLDRATFSNIEQQSLEFVKYCLTPWAERWEASLEAEIADDDAIEVEVDFDNLLRGDSAARSAYYSSGILNGWLTRNEARAAENLPPLEGLDEPLRPLNMATEEDAERLPAAPSAPQPNGPPAPQPNDD